MQITRLQQPEFALNHEVGMNEPSTSPSPTPAEFDIFLSYRRTDGPRIQPLLAALESLGLHIWRDTSEIEEFSSIQQAIDNGLANSKAMLVWYSADYPKSRACQWELTAGYIAAQAAGDPRRRILVVNPAAASGHIHLPELLDEHYLLAPAADDPAAIAAAAKRIGNALAGVAGPLGAIRALRPPRWLPAPATGSTRFVGRLAEMWQIHGRLLAGDAAMLTGTGGKQGVVQVRGSGGSGKSLLAEEYALRFGAAYPGGVFWLRAYGHADGGVELSPEQRAASRESQLRSYAQYLGFEVKGLEPAAVTGVLHAYFERQGQPFLWVIDDFPSAPGPEGLKPWLAPHALGRSLITTRSRSLSAIARIELPELDPDEAHALLTRAGQPEAMPPADGDEEAAAREICQQLGRHALAIDVAAGLVRRRGYRGFVNGLGRADRDILELAAELGEDLPNGHQRNIAATFLASIRLLGAAGQDFLRLAAQLAAAPIPRQLVVAAFAAADKVDQRAAEDKADLASDDVLRHSLAEEAVPGALTVHTLIARTLRFREQNEARVKVLRDALVAALNEALPAVVDIRNHGKLENWVVHARSLAANLEDEPTATLLGWVARHDQERGDYWAAGTGYERQFAARRRVLGAEHPDTLASMGNLAISLHSQGDLAGARQLQETVLAARRRVLGAEHPDTLTVMSNLALTLESQGDLAGARQLEESVLEARRRLLGAEHPDTLTAMNNLATTFEAQGDLAGARQLEETVLEARRRVLGAEHPDTLASMSNLASTLQSQGDLAGARQLQETVLAAHRRLLGAEHPDTLISMKNLANTLRRQGDLAGARQLEETVLAAHRRLLGAEHPDTLISMSNLAISLQSQGDLAGARQLEETVLAAHRRVLGAEHPDTLASMSNLASTLWNQGDLAGARQLQETVLAARRRVLGAEHPDTLAAMNNLANTLQSQGDLAGARQLQETVLAAHRRLLGAEHPDTLISMNNLANTLRRQGDLAGARQLQETVLAARRRVLGAEHPNTSVSAWNYLMSLLQSGEPEAAQKVFARDLAWLLLRDAATLGADQHSIAGMLRELLERGDLDWSASRDAQIDEKGGL